jgi:hypothetical protein
VFSRAGHFGSGGPAAFCVNFRQNAHVTFQDYKVLT